MTNEPRGEISLLLGGINYVLRPTFNALACIESQLGKSLLTLLSQFSDKGITLNEQIQIIRIGTEASGKKINLSDQELGELILKSSIQNVVIAVCRFIQKGLGLL